MDLGVMTLVTIVTLAVVQDLSSMKISNSLILIGLITGMGSRIWGEGISISLSVIWNMLFPIITLYLLFVARIIGAGDIKLFSVIGSFLEFKALVSCMIYAFMAGAVLAAIMLVHSGDLYEGCRSALRYYARIMKGERVAYQRRVVGKSNLMHFSIAIGLGLLCELVKRALWNN